LFIHANHLESRLLLMRVIRDSKCGANLKDFIVEWIKVIAATNIFSRIIPIHPRYEGSFGL